MRKIVFEKTEKFKFLTIDQRRGKVRRSFQIQLHVSVIDIIFSCQQANIGKRQEFLKTKIGQNAVSNIFLGQKNRQYLSIHPSGHRRLQDVLKRSGRLTTKPDVLKTSGTRRLNYEVLKTSDLRRLEDVGFLSS